MKSEEVKEEKNEQTKRKYSVCKLMIIALFMLFMGILIISLVGNASAKSVYVISDINKNPTPIQAYDIQPSPSYLIYQSTHNVTRYGGGGVGLAIDTDSETLFVTYEGFPPSLPVNTIQLVDAKTFADLGTTSAPNATNLAGIVVDQDNQKVYCIDRNTDHLYVYSWDASTKTLTNDVVASPYYLSLSGVVQAHGIALDETNDLLYVGDLTTSIKVYNTGTWTFVGYVNVSQKVMAVAVDVSEGYVYSGNAYTGYGSTGILSQYDLNTDTEDTVDIRAITGYYQTSSYNGDCVVGVAVDQATGLVYITTGNQATSASSTQIMVFDNDLNNLYNTGSIGHPTGIVVPGKDVSYNPLNLSKEDGLDYDAEECVCPGGTIKYQITYDNLANTYAVTGVDIVDILPDDVAFSSATGGGWYDSTHHTVTWKIGNLSAGAGPFTLGLIVTVDSGAEKGSTLDNTVVIDSVQTPPTSKHEYTLICSEPPKMVTVCLKDSNGDPLSGAMVWYYKNCKTGWMEFGTTDETGCVSMDIPNGTYTFKMTYAGFTQYKAYVYVETGSVVKFQTILVTVKLMDSNCDPLDTGSVMYAPCSYYYTMGDTEDGQVTMELLPGKYNFKMTYEGRVQYIHYIYIESTPTVVFQTTLTTVKLIDSNGDPLDTGTVYYWGSGKWHNMGDTDNGKVTKELLPLTYRFKMAYAGYNMHKDNIDITKTPTICYQTGQVHSKSNEVVKYYSLGSWKIFTQDMQLLPGTYKFKYSDYTEMVFTVEAGKINYIP